MQLKKILYFILILYANYIIAAGPITHAFLAQQWLNKNEHFTTDEEYAFIRGNLFPDIRYLKIISREETHYKHVTVKDIISDTNPFSKGKKLHSFIDIEREKLVVSWLMYNKLKDIPGQKYICTFLKLLEDEVIYKKKKWLKIRQALTHIEPNEVPDTILEINVKTWYKTLDTSFSMPPSKYLQKMITHKTSYLHIPANILNKWIAILPKLAQNQTIVDYVDTLISQFDHMFMVGKTNY